MSLPPVRALLGRLAVVVLAGSALLDTACGPRSAPQGSTTSHGPSQTSGASARVLPDSNPEVVKASGSGVPRLAIVGTERASQVDPDVTPELRSIITAAVQQQALVCVITADGVPRTVRTLQVATTGRNAKIKSRQNDQSYAAIVGLLRSPAATAEANPLQAIGIAARWLAAGDGLKRLVVIDSGLQTVAPLRFEDGLLDPSTSPAQVATVVRAEDFRPDLADVSTIWFGLGQSVSPQAPLTLAALDLEQRIWKAVLTGPDTGSLEFSGDQLNTASPPSDLPSVSQVPVPTPGSAAGVSQRPHLTDPISWRDVSFVGDQAVLTDPASARSALVGLAHQLIAGGYLAIHVDGTTADVGSFDGQRSLSVRRAQVVASLLIGLGVPAGHITEVGGFGSSFPGHIPEYNPDGSWDEQRAAQDRMVIVSASS